MSTSPRLAPGLHCCLLLFLLFGCGDNRPTRAKVSGQVLLDGKPVTRGVVQIFPTGARPCYGQIGPDGRFTLGTFSKDDGCPVGTHPMAVVVKEMIDPTKIRWLAPKKYSNPDTSGLTIVVENETDNEIIQLTSEPGSPFVPFTEILSSGPATE